MVLQVLFLERYVSNSVKAILEELTAGLCEKVSFVSCAVLYRDTNGTAVLQACNLDDKPDLHKDSLQPGITQLSTGEALLVPLGSARSGGEYFLFCRSANSISQEQAAAAETMAAAIGHLIEVTANVHKFTAAANLADSEGSIEQVYFEQLFENAPLGLVILDANDRIVRVNRQFERLFGYRLQEIQGQNLGRVIVPPGLMEEASALTPNLEDKQVVSAQTVRRHKNGTLVHVSILGFPIVLHGEQVGTYGIYSDISARVAAERELHISKERYELAVSGSNDGIWDWDLQSGKLYVSPRGYTMLGFTSREAFRAIEDFFALIDSQNLGRFKQALDDYFAKRKGHFVQEVRLRTRDGSYRWIRVRGQALWGTDGQPVRMAGSCTDVTEYRLAEQKLKESEQKFRLLFEKSADAILLVDSRGQILDCNQAAVAMMECGDKQQLVTNTVSELSPDRQPDGRISSEKIPELINIALTTGNHRFEWVHQTQSGEVFPTEVVLTTVPVDGQQVVHALVRDITERKRAEETIRHQTYHHPLTGLPNRTLFANRLRLAVTLAQRRQRRVAVLFMDLDRFKNVNDVMGHSAGDELLQLVAERLSQLVSGTDLVAHVSGDEFAVLLSHVKAEEEAYEFARQIQETLSSPFSVQGREIHITASIGIALYPECGYDAETLLKNADSACYSVKKQGRNAYQLFTTVLNTQAARQLTVESALRRALAEDQFVVYYQPQVDLFTGRIVGVEALVRWRHPDLGLIPPMEFIPIAEETGLIVPIGNWVLQAACQQHLSWRQQGLNPGTVTVNLSALQLQQQNLVETVKRIIAATGMLPGCLGLEITESVAMEDAAFTNHVLNDLSTMGVQLIIDDFGTGYSSLLYLRELPITALKVDRSFIKDLENSRNDAAITAGVVALAHSLNLKVVAEGVETDKQVTFLRQHSCDQMQGYLFSPPLPPEQITCLLQEDKRL